MKASLLTFVTLVAISMFGARSQEKTHDVDVELTFVQFPNLAVSSKAFASHATAKAFTGEVIVFQSSETVVALTIKDCDNSMAEYAYVMFDRTSGEETKGSGRVFEKYDRVVEGGVTTAIDVGSKLDIQLGTISLVWSAGGSEHGYLYFDPSKLVFANLLDIRIDDITFSK